MSSASKRFYRQKRAVTKKLHWAFADWLKQGYFPYMRLRGVLELGLVISAEQTRADWLTEALLFWESQARNLVKF